jgi:hypothetical protein
LSGVFEKKTNAVAKRVLDFYEDMRYKYLSALDDPKEYGTAWKNAVKKLRTDFDGLGDFTAELKKYLDEDNVFNDESTNPESTEAKKLYNAIKELRFKSKEMNDPFARQLGDKVIETLVKKPSVYAMFIHYALRSHTHALDRKSWENNDIKPDEITEGARGLDLELKDIPLYLTEHYGDDVDTSRVKSKFEGALKLLEKVYLSENSQDSWDKLVAVDIKKEDEEKSEEEKSEIEFLIPNKPMYRIFEIDDLKELKGFSGEWLVQEKFDGIRIQIHKKNNKVQIFTYNEKDITDKCKDIVEKAKQKRFGDMILDAELILYDGDEPLHRADTIAHLFKNKYKDATLKARIFDIMNHDGKDLTDTPLKERINILFYQLTPGSSDLFNFPSKKNTRIADSIAEVEKYSKSLMESKTSEGVVIKDIESTYYIGNKKNPKWIKWKKFVDLDVIVLDKKKTKSNLYSYSVGVGPLSGEQAREHNGTEIEGKTYLPVGKALNTKESVDIGAIIRVKVDEVRRKDKGYSLYSAKVIEIPEVDSPEKLITLELLSKEGRKTLKYDIEDALLKYTITDGIHGKADIIMKSDLDGFTIYGFEGDSLMQKNALADIDLWKEQLGEMIKSKTSDARMSIKNYLIEEGRPTELKDIFRWANENIPDLTQKLWEGDFNHFSSWMKDFTGDFKRVGESKYTENPVMITKDDSKQALYKLSIREDDNIELVITYKDEEMIWIIDIKDSEDIYNLFGKSGKFPAEIGERSQPSKLLDKGAILLGVQKHGYHEYKLDGDKFRTRLHFRVVPVKEKDKWVVWTGIKQKMLDTKEDEGLWDITEDRFKKLTMQFD